MGRHPRTGTRLRLCGAVVIAAELLLFASPVTVGAYVPKRFFGAVLTFIAADLLVDWLWAARHKVHPTEYAIILLTFGAINCFGLEVGMCGGVLIAMCHFIIDYASAPVVRRIDVRSTVLRSFAHSRALAGSDIASGSFLVHLHDTEDILRGWECDEATCLAGLYHSIYVRRYHPSPILCVSLAIVLTRGAARVVRARRGSKVSPYPSASGSRCAISSARGRSASPTSTA